MSIDRTLRRQAEDKTTRHWKYFSDPLERRRVETYINDLLPFELECAKSDTDQPPRLPPTDKRGGTLVLLVGFSLDPLLQAICTYQPSKLVLVLNAQYGEQPTGRTGWEFGNYIVDLLPKLSPLLIPMTLTKACCELIVLDKDQPTDVFRKLRDKLLQRLREGERLILDVTGGKKSMVSGAFLFGAFAGVDLSYVDFEEYDPKQRSPRGYTCRIGLLQNPYEVLRLRDWERVRLLYERYSFRDAAALLNEVVPSMSGWFSGEEIHATEALCDLMRMYELWDNGDFHGSFLQFQKIMGKVKDGCVSATAAAMMPTAVHMLGQGEYWPHGNDADTLLSQLKVLEFGNNEWPSLYVDLGRLLVYARDEQAKVERLIRFNADYRSALLRAVGLTEVLLRARVVILLHVRKVEIAFKPESKANASYETGTSVTPELERWLPDIRKRVIEQESVYPFIALLRFRAEGNADERRITKLTCRSGEEVQEFWLRRTIDAPLLPKDVRLGKETELRNKAIHTYLSVPKPVAEQTLAIARSSVDDFANQWPRLVSARPIEVRTEAPDWSVLCETCGVRFLPPTKENH